MDIEINEKDPKKLAAIVCALEPSFGAINLEDIKAPECFEVGRRQHSYRYGMVDEVAVCVRQTCSMSLRYFAGFAQDSHSLR